MFPPFDQELAASALSSLLDFLQSGRARLVRNARLSDNRDTSSVMLGAIVCQSVKGKETLLTVSGISCALEGEFDGVFVEPVVSSLNIEEALSKNDAEIHSLTDIILLEEKKLRDRYLSKAQEAEKRDFIRRAKERRISLCDESLLKVFGKYSFFCFDGKKRTMLSMIKERGFLRGLPPTGTGDCCAPKLLSYAFEHSLRPLSMAETKIHFTLEGRLCRIREESFKAPMELVPPCDSRCALILPGILGLEIVYRDSDIIVVNKQSGVLSVPGRGEDKQDCIASRVRRLFPFCIEQPAVHRLDMETSGLMVLAFTKEAHRKLNRQFENREVLKEYTALVDGVLAKKGIAEEGSMELYHRVDIERRPLQIWDRENGKLAVTQWKIDNVQYYKPPASAQMPATRVKFIPLTGRTHQLRFAAASIHGFGSPIIGDSLYGHREEGERLMLHASYLKFTHPLTGEQMEFKSPAPF